MVSTGRHRDARDVELQPTAAEDRAVGTQRDDDVLRTSGEQSLRRRDRVGLAGEQPCLLTVALDEEGLLDARASLGHGGARGRPPVQAQVRVEDHRDVQRERLVARADGQLPLVLADERVGAEEQRVRLLDRCLQARADRFDRGPDALPLDEEGRLRVLVDGHERNRRLLARDETKPVQPDALGFEP